MLVLSSADLDAPLEKIRTDVLKTAYACYWSEMVYAWLEDGKPQEALYDLLFFSLKALNTGSIDTATTSLLFQIRFMTLAGMSPEPWWPQPMIISAVISITSRMMSIT